MDGFIFILWTCCSRIEVWTVVKHPPNTDVAGAVVILAPKSRSLCESVTAETQIQSGLLLAHLPHPLKQIIQITLLHWLQDWYVKRSFFKATPWSEESKWCCPAPDRPNTLISATFRPTNLLKLWNLPLSALHVHSYKHNSEPLLSTFMFCPYVFVYSFLYDVKEKLVWLRFFLGNIFGHSLFFFLESRF